MIYLWVFLCLLSAKAQAEKVDSLRNALEKHVRVDRAQLDILNDLAYSAYAKNTEEAKSYALRSREVSGRLGYRKGEATSLWILGLTFLRSDNNTALDYFRQSIAVAEKEDDKLGVCRCLMSIGSVMRTLGDLEESDESLGRALAIAREIQDPVMEMKILYHQALNHRHQGNVLEALANIQEALALAEKVGDRQMLANCMGFLASVYQRQGDFAIALEYYLSALKVKESLGDDLGIYYLLVNIAGAQSEQGDFEAASGTIQTAFQMSRERGDTLQMSACLANMGNIHLRAEKPTALPYFQEALAMVKENNVGLRINILIGIGTIYMDRGEFDKALGFFNEALVLAREARLKGSLGEVWIKVGSLFFTWSHYGQALDYGQKALRVAEELNLKELQRDCRKLLSDIYAAMRTFDKAYENYASYKSISDSLFNEKNTRKIAIMESAYKHEKEKRAYEMEKVSRELEIKNQRLIILFLCVASTLICILSFMIYRANKLKKRVLLLESEQVNRELERNQKEMAAATLKLVQNSEREANNIKVLENIKKNTMEEGRDEIRSLIADYKLKSYGSNWDEFEILFKKVNGLFYEQLNGRYPNLTPNERRLCVFLKLNMSNNHISQVTYQSEEALKKARLRLRKKLGIERDVNLAAFIQNL